METNTKREVIRKVYSGEGWSLKVDAMPDYQVDAVFDRFVQDGLVILGVDLARSADFAALPSGTIVENKYKPYEGEQIKFDI